mgnify:CR=1 FL=1
MNSKFSSSGCEQLYNMSLEGGHEEEIGNVEGLGWNCYLSYTGIKDHEFAILHQDNEGFVSETVYTTYEELMREWKQLKKIVEEFENGIVC